MRLWSWIENPGGLIDPRAQEAQASTRAYPLVVWDDWRTVSGWGMSAAVCLLRAILMGRYCQRVGLKRIAISSRLIA